MRAYVRSKTGCVCQAVVGPVTNSHLDSNKEITPTHPTTLISIVFRLELKLGSCEGGIVLAPISE